MMNTSRGKRLRLNTISSLIFQCTTIICGFILPRIILSNFGSQVNGLVNSINQFLHVITFLELGVGAVVQSSLYKPLADNDYILISKIVHSAEKFFSRIAYILIVYIICLIIGYPILVNKDFGFLYTATMIIAIGISSFAQYYFGVVDRLLLTADQKGYIQYNAQTITLILNTAVCTFLIIKGQSIHLVKLVTSFIYLLRPVFLRIYVNRNYRIDRKIAYDKEPINQKWNGIAQHIASVVLDQTDIIVLTSLSTLSNVSIYSVYHLVIYGVKQLFRSMTNGFQSVMGEMLAKNETEQLKKFFSRTEWLLHTGTVFVFGCTGVLVVPFVMVYTEGITDANYILPLFAVLITIAHAGHCLRLPYNILILAAGHYKQTQWNYIFAAGLNVVISALTVRAWGLIGVAIGTLVAMLYQTVWMAVYDSKHILNTPFKGFVKHIVVDVLTVAIAGLLTFKIPMHTISYASWILLAIIDATVWMVVIAFVNSIFYRFEMKQIMLKLISAFRR